MSQSRLAIAPALDDAPPKLSRSVTRRAEILRTAEDVFLAQGYANTTMDDIAARAGASKATMYKHFGSKEALFAEIVRNSVPTISTASREVLQSAGTMHAILVNWSLQLLRAVTTPRSVAMYKLIIAESSRSPELAKIYYAKGPVLAQQLLAKFFKQASADRRMRCADPGQASRLFVSLVFGDGFERALYGIAPESDRTHKAYVSEAVAMFLSRYGASPNI